MTLTYDRLKEVFHYDPRTGLITWRTAVSSMTVVGSIAGTIDREGYRIIRVDGRRHKAHRLAWFYVYGRPPVGPLDHKNCDPGDNRIVNLRQATVAQNAYNVGRRRNNTSGFKGVSWHRRKKKWQAKVTANGRQIYVGDFSDAKDAAAAARQATELYHGEFARVD